MKRLSTALLAGMLVVTAHNAAAHPVPFSYVDLHIETNSVELTVVVHVFDVAHELQIGAPEQLLDPPFLERHNRTIADLLASRLRVLADGASLTDVKWSAAEPLPDRRSISVRARGTMPGPPGQLDVTARLFPYDDVHQTFVNVYEGDNLRLQGILDRSKTRLEYFPGSRQGAWAVTRRFLPAGFHHILIGPDHLLFLVGLLLLGGSIRRLMLVVSAFTVAHSVTLSIAALGIWQPPARIIEPAIALSIVYVGADNLMVKGGRDVRAWIAFGFGFIHGFGFASVLREMNLPSSALGWSLLSFNVGVELGQLLVVVAVGSALALLRARSAQAAHRLAHVGSVAVILAGTFWFIQRVL